MSAPTYEEFAARLAQPCRFAQLIHDVEQPSRAAVLHRVGERRERSGYEQFTLIFHVEAHDAPQQGMHAVTFADGMRWEIFVVPIARLAAGIAYEACYNRSLA